MTKSLFLMAAVLLFVSATTARDYASSIPFRFDDGSKNPWSLEVADLNHDNLPDLIYTDFSLELLIRFGLGRGQFSDPVAYQPGITPVDLAVADFDGDGDQDVVVGNTSEYRVSVFINTGDGILTQIEPIVPVAYIPYTIEAADLTGDNLPDLVFSNGDECAIALNLGNAAFSAVTLLEPSGLDGGFSLVDWDGDTDLDIVSTQAQPPVVTVFTNDGTGGYVAQSPIPLPRRMPNVNVLDLNKDGQLDLVGHWYGEDSLLVALNSGTNQFLTVVSYDGGLRPRAVDFGDLDNDDDIDVVIVDSDSPVQIPGLLDELNVLLNNGTGSFATRIPTRIGKDPVDVAAVDLNNDGYLDIATTNPNSNEIVVLLNMTGSCGRGLTGNIDQDPQDLVTLTDVTTMVTRLFVNPQPFDCVSEANVDSDVDCEITLTDVTELVNHLFVTYQPLAPCLPSCD